MPAQELLLVRVVQLPQHNSAAYSERCTLGQVRVQEQCLRVATCVANRWRGAKVNKMRDNRDCKTYRAPTRVAAPHYLEIGPWARTSAARQALKYYKQLGQSEPEARPFSLAPPQNPKPHVYLYC